MYSEFRHSQLKNHAYTAQDNFPDYSRHRCIVKQYLTVEMYDRLFEKTTNNGVTLDKCIQPSCDNMGKRIGIVAGDEQSYQVFKELFDPIIDHYHKGFTASQKQPSPELDESKLIGGLLDEKYVRSCRVRAGRSIRGFCLPPAICRAERRHVERIIVDILSGLEGELSGVYYPLTSMTPEQEKALIEEHFLFQKPQLPNGHLMVNSGAARDWPDARGIWYNKEKNFLVWINEEDHCRVISMQSGGDMRQTFARFCNGIKQIERQLTEKGHEFMWNERLGYICTCPSNLGTVLRCSVHMQLKLLSKHPQFKWIVKGLGLQKRGTNGEHTEAVDSLYDISNSARLKKTEREFVQLVIDGVGKLIQMEKRLENNETIEDLIPAFGA